MKFLSCIYSFITKANQVLFFLGICTILVLTGIGLYREFYPANHGPQVRIETTQDTDTPASTDSAITDISVLYYDETTTVIGTWKLQVQRTREIVPIITAQAKLSPLYGSDAPSGSLVNARIFKTGSSSYRNLLPADGLILGRNFQATPYHERTHPSPAFIFEVVTTDTNSDSVLTPADDHTLILVDRTQEKPDLKIENVISHTSPASQKIIVKAKRGDKIYFTEVDLATLQTHEIPWQ